MFNKSWIFSVFLGFLSASSAILLLAFSGYFLGSLALTLLIFPLWLFPLLAILRTLGRYLERIFSHYSALTYLAELRVKIFGNLINNQRVKTKNSAQFLHRLSADIELLNNFPLRFYLPLIWSLSLLILWLSVAIFLNFASISLICSLLIFALIIPYLGLYFSKKAALKIAFQNEKSREELLNSLYALPALLSWGTFNLEIKNFFKENEEVKNLEQELFNIANKSQLFQQLSLYITLGILLFNLQEAELKIMLLAFFSLLAYSQFALIENPAAYFLAQAGKKRLELFNNFEPKAREELAKQEIFLKVENLSLKMPNALTSPKKLNFALKKGDFLVIYGKSGIGKSSLLKAINAELDFTGKIEKSGKILYLAQEIDIFNDTLEANLKMGEDFEQSKILQILELVGLNSWVLEQKLGLKTQLGEYGAQISGGQAKRIALARLLLRDFDILLLDEPFAGIDANTRALILQNLKNYLNNEKICLIVSHEQLLGFEKLAIN